MKTKQLIAVLCLPLLLHAAPAAEKEKMMLLESGGEALVVRSAAISNPKTAMSRWLKPAAAAAFEKLTEKTYEGKKSYELSDFFNTSLILAGSQQENRGITAFYSPWQDAILLVLTEGKGAARRGLEFLFLTGETFRGEKFRDSLEVVTPKIDPLSVNLWRVQTATTARFNALFPLSGSPSLDVLKKNVNQETEFQNIRLRAVARVMLAQKLMTDSHRLGLANCLICLRALQTGTPQVLKRVFGAQDPVGMVAAMEKVPAGLRKNIEPVYSLVSEKGMQFGFLNPGAPRFVFLVSVNADNKFTLEWFDLNEAAVLYKAWEDAK